MLKKLKLLIVSALAISSFIGMPAMVSAQTNNNSADIKNSLCSGANLKLNDPSGCNADGTVNENKLNKLIAKVINIVSVIVAVVAVIMIIVGGFKYITSGGDSNNVTGAKNTILYAIIGLIIVALAQFIVKFVLNTSNSIQQ